MTNEEIARFFNCARPFIQGNPSLRDPRVEGWFRTRQHLARPANLGYTAQWGVCTDWETLPSGDKTPLPLMGVRYYDPITGRFLARDPIQSGTNLYSNADGNSVRYIGPTGLYVETVADVVGLAMDVNDFRNKPSWTQAERLRT